VNDDTIYDGQFADCQDVEIRPNRGWRGKIKISVSASGFNAQEPITGNGTVDYTLGPF
jgi:hypothetical protein